MSNHIILLLIFAALVSTVFAILARDQPRQMLRYGVLVFTAFVLTALVVGWLMYPFPR